MKLQDRTNRQTWADSWSLKYYSGVDGFIEEGEKVAYQWVASHGGGETTLDLGVGGGRTVSMLEPLSRQYIAVDYMQEMVEATHQRFPHVDVRLGDARNLSALPSNYFSLVVFSNRGIDSVGHDDRQDVLAEVHRVLKPNGIFWYSTLNKWGPGPRHRPWKPRWPEPGADGRAYILDCARVIRRIPKETLNYFKVARHSQEGAGWAMAPFFPHGYNLLVHYTTLQYECDALSRIGFRQDIGIFDDEFGRPLGLSDETGHIQSFHLLARK